LSPLKKGGIESKIGQIGHHKKEGFTECYKKNYFSPKKGQLFGAIYKGLRAEKNIYQKYIKSRAVWQHCQRLIQGKN